MRAPKSSSAPHHVLTQASRKPEPTTGNASEESLSHGLAKLGLWTRLVLGPLHSLQPLAFVLPWILAWATHLTWNTESSSPCRTPASVTLVQLFKVSSRFQV